VCLIGNMGKWATMADQGVVGVPALRLKKLFFAPKIFTAVSPQPITTLVFFDESRGRQVTVGASIENILINYILLHLLASPGPSESAHRADTMLINP
jgi:hypothetical protein